MTYVETLSYCAAVNIRDATRFSNRIAGEIRLLEKLIDLAKRYGPADPRTPAILNRAEEVKATLDTLCESRDYSLDLARQHVDAMEAELGLAPFGYNVGDADRSRAEQNGLI